jgi:Clostridial hydrophobic W
MPQVVAHVQKTGDVGQDFGTWLGKKGSKLWIEGFGISPPEGLQPEDIEYQAVLGKGWMSPWVTAGKFCGSRGMALPLLGIRVRLSEKASRTHTVTYSATFIDGTEVGPGVDGEPCDSANLAPLEALNISVERKPLKPVGKTPTTPRRSR